VNVSGRQNKQRTHNAYSVNNLRIVRTLQTISCIRFSEFVILEHYTNERQMSRHT